MHIVTVTIPLTLSCGLNARWLSDLVALLS
jgi:hypothetical protein